MRNSLMALVGGMGVLGAASLTSAATVNIETNADRQYNGSGTGSNTELVQTRDNGIVGYYRFDMSGVTNTVTAATLNLVRWDPDSSAEQVRLWALTDANDTWNDSSATMPYPLVDGGNAVLLGTLDVSASSADALGDMDSSHQDEGGVWASIALPASAINFINNNDSNNVLSLAFSLGTMGGDALAGSGKFYALSREADATIGTTGVTVASNPFGTEESPRFGAYLSVNEVPEPAALSVLSLAALGLGRRRRIA